MKLRVIRVYAFSLILLGFADVSTAEEESVAPQSAPKPVPIWCLDFSPDGSMLAAAAGQRGSSGLLSVRDMRSWEEIFSLPEPRAVTCVAFAPDGQQLAFGTQNGEIAVVDLPQQSIVRRWPSGKWAVFGINWTPDGQNVIGALANGVINVWQAGSGELQTTFDLWQADGIPNPKKGGHADRNMWDVTVSKDGKTLLSACWNDTARLWSLETNELIHSFAGEDERTQGVKFLSDDKYFVTAGMGRGGVRVRETGTFRECLRIPVSGRDVSVDPQDRYIAASTMSTVAVYHVQFQTLNPDASLRARALLQQLSSEDSAKKANALAALKELGNGLTPLIDEAMKSSETAVHPEYDAFWKKYIGETQRPRPTGSTELETLWKELHTPEIAADLDGMHGEVRQVVFSPTGEFLAASTTEGLIQVWTVPAFLPWKKCDVLIPRAMARNAAAGTALP